MYALYYIIIYIFIHDINIYIGMLGDSSGSDGGVAWSRGEPGIRTHIPTATYYYVCVRILL